MKFNFYICSQSSVSAFLGRFEAQTLHNLNNTWCNPVRSVDVRSCRLNLCHGVKISIQRQVIIAFGWVTEGDISSSSSRVSTGFPSQANSFSIIKLNYSKSWKKIPAPVHLQAPRSSPAPLQVAMRSPLQKKVKEVKSAVPTLHFSRPKAELLLRKRRHKRPDAFLFCPHACKCRTGTGQ